jgi:hypothetical protein
MYGFSDPTITSATFLMSNARSISFQAMTLFPLPYQSFPFVNLGGSHVNLGFLDILLGPDQSEPKICLDVILGYSVPFGPQSV